MPDLWDGIFSLYTLCMITDQESNCLYLADCLPGRYPEVYAQMVKIAKENSIPVSLLPYTKDIWAKDFMPVQVRERKFVQFVYNPDYLRNSMKWRKTITDVDTVCSAINLHVEISSIILDGGNVITANNKVILTDKIFSENSGYSRSELTQMLEELFEVETIIIVPADPNDFTGHADGMVRFYDNNTVLVNDYANEPTVFRETFRKALLDAGLRIISIPYNPYHNLDIDSARGVYINYLQMKGVLILPVYDLPEDDAVINQMRSLFTEYNVYTIECSALAAEGGVLNCISWGIYSSCSINLMNTGYVI